MPALFTLTQSSSQLHGTGNIALALPAAPASQNNMLFATILSPNDTTPFTPPTLTGGALWQLASAWSLAGIGRLEQWYLANNNDVALPTSHTFIGASGADMRGGISEHGTPTNTWVIFESIGRSTGLGTTGATITVKTANGTAVPDCLGILSIANFFSANVPGGTWTLPAGFTQLQNLHNGVTDCWYSAANEDLTSAGYQTVTSGLTTTANETGWIALYACFRCVAFYRVGLDGAEMSTAVAVDPTGQVLVLGGDVEGMWTTPDFGNNWQCSQRGVIGSSADNTACMEWSPFETGVVYACTGNANTPAGFQVSLDGGKSWSVRSAAVLFNGNAAGVRPGGPRATSAGMDQNRSVGHLLAFDTTNGVIYAATYNGGIARSNSGATPGTSWTVLGMTNTNYYPRAICVNPANTSEIFVGTWDSDGTGAWSGVFHCTNGMGASPSFAKFGTGGPTDSVTDLLILGNYLYATEFSGGIWQIPLAGGTWKNLNGTFIDTTVSEWTTLDGYVSGSQHIIITACGNGLKPSGGSYFQGPVQLTIASNGSGAVTYTDLLNQPGATCTIATIPPDNRPFWRWNTQWHYWLSGFNYFKPFVRIDPTNRQRIYLAGSGGFARSMDGGMTWVNAINGLEMWAVHDFQLDPNNAGHMVCCTSDFFQVDMTDAYGVAANSTTESNPVSAGGNECHAASFDPVTSDVYTATNTKYGSNSGGAVYVRPWNQPNNWTDLKFAAVAGPNAVIGLYAGRDASNKLFVLAISQGNGLYRGTVSGTTWTWVNPDGNTISQGGQVGQIIPFTVGQNAKNIWCYDRKKGIWYSGDYGMSWTLIWTHNSGTTGGGWIACNTSASPGGEIWASASDGLWRLTGANASVTVPSGNITQFTTAFPNGAGGIAFYGGRIYAVALPGTGFDTQLVSSGDGGATWPQADASGPCVGSYSPSPVNVRISPTGLLWLGSGYNVGIIGQLGSVSSISGTAVYSGKKEALYGTATITFPPISGSGGVRIPKVVLAGSSSIPVVSGTGALRVPKVRLLSGGASVSSYAGTSIYQTFKVKLLGVGTVTTVFNPPTTYLDPVLRKVQPWRYYAQRALTGEWLDRVGIPFSGVTLGWDLTSGSFSGTIQPTYQRLIASDGLPILEEWATLLYAVDSTDQIRWGGILSSANFVGSQWSLAGVGYRAWANGQIYIDREKQWTDVDPLDIVRFLWGYLQSQDDSNLHLQVPNTTSPVRIGTTTQQNTVTDKSGQSRTVTQTIPFSLAGWNGTDIGQELANLATATPFDMDESHSWLDDGRNAVNHYLLIGYPRLGTRQSQLRFVEGENIDALVQVTRGDGTQTYANTGVGYGAGTGSKMQRIEMANPDGVHLRRMMTVTDQSITDWHKLAPLVRRNLVIAQGQVQGSIASCSFIDHGNAPLGSFTSGDDILIQVRSGWLAGQSIWHRITGYTYTPESARGTLNLARSDSFTYESNLAPVETG